MGGSGPDAGRAAGMGSVGEMEGASSVRCWQNGKEVLSQDGFAGAQVGEAAGRQAVRLEGGQSTLLLVPIQENLCAVTVERP